MQVINSVLDRIVFGDKIYKPVENINTELTLQTNHTY
jgi:hypothetical protein